MKRRYLIIDLDRCVGCNNCLMACKDEHVDNEWPGYSSEQPRHGHRWIDVKQLVRGQFPIIDVIYLPTTCMHCAEAPCIKAAGGAVTRRSDGIVLIDPVKARGKKELVEVCPYGQIWWEEKKKVAQKCTLCAHLLDEGWDKPRCVQACPNGALSAMFLEEARFDEIKMKEKLEVLHPEYNTRPSVYYKNLKLFTNCFIAGSVAIKTEDGLECAKGSRVSLVQGGKVIAEQLVDAFGDFKFDGLVPKSNKYLLGFQLPGFEQKKMEVDLQESVCIGMMTFEIKL